MSLLYNDGATSSRYAGNGYRRSAAILLDSIFVVLFGLAFGSFLNVCIARLPRHESIVSPGSRCPHCRTPLRRRDNLPILSWMLLRGRCRNCRWKIPWRYPAVEAATAALFLLCDLRFGLAVTGIGMAILCFLLFGLAVMDAETMRLPDTFTLPGILLGIVYAALQPATTPLEHLWHAGASILWAIAAALLILAIRGLYYLLRHVEGMGIGDAKLLALIAAWLGPALTLLTMILGTFAAALFGFAIVLLSPSKRRSLATRIPFGSFLCAAAIYVIFAGQPLLRWYMQFFP